MGLRLQHLFWCARFVAHGADLVPREPQHGRAAAPGIFHTRSAGASTPAPPFEDPTFGDGTGYGGDDLRIPPRSSRPELTGSSSCSSPVDDDPDWTSFPKGTFTDAGGDSGHNRLRPPHRRLLQRPPLLPER
ncbi:MAG: hypothetical protein M5T61_10370 [Acidimicrobiia bacterium]|nr:hypothetical protein [Acidimicrobiia bacterium]